MEREREDGTSKCEHSNTHTLRGGSLRTRADCFVLTNQNEIRCIDVIELSCVE